MEKIYQPSKVPHVCGGDGADDAPALVAVEPLHGIKHLLEGPLVFPVFPSAVGNLCGWGVQRNPDANFAAREELNGCIVQQRRIGLDAEQKILSVFLDANKDRFAIE